MSAQFSELITSFAVYENAVDYYGIADVTMPNLQQITESMEGAGVAGKYDAVVLGHIEAMKLSIQFRNPTRIAFKLFTLEDHQLDLRANIQERDTVKGIKNVGLKHVVKCVPINLDIGKLGNYVKGDTKAEYSVNYLATYMDGEEVLCVDPFNYIFRVNGKDFLEDVRKNIGKA